jgi:hypothetical protein
MVFTTNLLTFSALASAAFAIPGPSWFRRQTGAQESLSALPLGSQCPRPPTCLTNRFVCTFSARPCCHFPWSRAGRPRCQPRSWPSPVPHLEEQLHQLLLDSGHYPYEWSTNGCRLVQPYTNGSHHQLRCRTFIQVCVPQEHRVDHPARPAFHHPNEGPQHGSR